MLGCTNVDVRLKDLKSKEVIVLYQLCATRPSAGLLPSVTTIHYVIAVLVPYHAQPIALSKLQIVFNMRPAIFAAMVLYGKVEVLKRGSGCRVLAEEATAIVAD